MNKLYNDLIYYRKTGMIVFIVLLMVQATWLLSRNKNVVVADIAIGYMVDYSVDYFAERPVRIIQKKYFQEPDELEYLVGRIQQSLSSGLNKQTCLVNVENIEMMRLKLVCKGDSESSLRGYIDNVFKLMLLKHEDIYKLQSTVRVQRLFLLKALLKNIERRISSLKNIKTIKEPELLFANDLELRLEYKLLDTKKKIRLEDFFLQQDKMTELKESNISVILRTPGFLHWVFVVLLSTVLSVLIVFLLASSRIEKHENS